MINNYKKDEYGVISQIEYTPFTYDIEYSDSRYSNFNDRGNILNLRLGYIIGSIGKIPESLMDVGYGNGDFLNVCKSSIKSLYANDILPAYPLSSDIKFVENIVDQKVEVITFFDSLEHFPNIDFVKDLQCKYVIISLPWCYNGEDEKWFSEWKHRKPNEHLHHFNEKSLENFMKSKNFKMINFCNLEDSIRVDKNLNPNILTAAFIKVS